MKSQVEKPPAPSAQTTAKHESGPSLQDSPGALARTPRMLQQKATIQAVFGSAVQREQAPAPNHTGMPSQLKAGIESLSGLSMDDVRVHYNSDQPAQLNALAYAQGTDIHLGPGQEKHLPHEAWHVVQQRQGRVQPTAQMAGVPINDHPHLEREADELGAQAAQLSESPEGKVRQPKKIGASVSQLMLGEHLVDEDPERGEQRGQAHDHEQGEDTVGTVGWASSFVLPTRWYSWDGRNTYVPRTIGLPAATGWVDINATRKGKPIYMSFEDFARWAPAQTVREIATEVQALAEHIPLLHGAVRNQEAVIDDVRQVQQRFLTVNAALGEYLNRGSTPIKLILSVLGLTAAISGGILLSYVTLPAWAVATVDGLSFLYGCYVLYRWTTSKLLPTMVKMVLLLANAGAMVGATAPLLAQLAAYYIGLTETFPLTHITLAAIPFALVIEQLIVAALERVNLVRQRFNERNRHGNEDHLE